MDENRTEPLASFEREALPKMNNDYGKDTPYRIGREVQRSEADPVDGMVDRQPPGIREASACGGPAKPKQRNESPLDCAGHPHGTLQVHEW